MTTPRGCTRRSDCRCGQTECLAWIYSSRSSTAKSSYTIHGDCQRTRHYLEEAESARRRFKDAQELDFKSRIEKM